MVATIKKILLYSGSSQIVGGEAKYFFNLINGIKSFSEYNCLIVSDRNKLFQDRANQWLKDDNKIHYLNTKPSISKNNISKFIDKNLKFKFFGKSASKYFELFLRIITFKFFFDFIYNFIIFNNIFRANQNIEVFHINNGSYPGRIAGVAGILAARYNKCPKIFMTIHNECNRIYDPLFFLYDFIIKSFCTKVIPVSNNVLQSLVNKKNFDYEKLKIISIGLDYDNNKFLSLKKFNVINENKTFKILISGNYDEKRKGHEQLFVAIKELVYIYKNILLLIVGSGSKERKKSLNDLAIYLGIENNIKFYGYVSNIEELNHECDIVVVPSVGSEAIPYTIIEGLKAGKPIITSDYGGCKEAVVSEYNGFIVDPYDAKLMAYKFHYLINDVKRLEQFGVNSRKLFEENFIQKDKVIEYLNLYK